MDHDEEEHGEIEVGNAAGDEHMIVEIQALEGEVEALSLSRKQGDEAFLRGKKVKSTSLCDVRDGRPSNGRGCNGYNPNRGPGLGGRARGRQGCPLGEAIPLHSPALSDEACLPLPLRRSGTVG